MSRTIGILVPCKMLKEGKSRLSSILDAPARRELCRAFLAATLETACVITKPSLIRVVTSDPEAAAIGRDYSVCNVADNGGGINIGLDIGRAELLEEIADQGMLLVLPTDLPFASPASIMDILSYPGDIVIAPDKNGSGTNLLLLRYRAVREFEFSFGPGSFSLHCTTARSKNLKIAVARDTRLAFDVDEPADYQRWMSGHGLNRGPM
jgi:2-phospho-L-lactate/phosphoenolpyruvate guanylyltransferase